MKQALNQRDVDLLTSAFRQFPEIEQVLLFGSRAKGNAAAASDIDLALKGENVTDTTVTRLHAALDDLPLPFFFDVVDYKAIQNKDLIDHIDRVGKVIFAKQSGAVIQ